MKTQYYTATSLDGFIATEDDSLDWLFPLGNITDTGYPAFIAEVGALAMGASTYEWMVRHAQKVASETGSAWPYEQPTWVFTHRGPSPIVSAVVDPERRIALDGELFNNALRREPGRAPLSLFARCAELWQWLGGALRP